MQKKNALISLMMAMLPFCSLQLTAIAGNVPLQVGIDDPSYGQGNPNKSPVLIPEVSINNYVLSFDDSCLGCELRLVDEDGNVVYTTTITSNTLVLPSNLSGEYELQIIRGIFCFYGYIEL